MDGHDDRMGGGPVNDSTQIWQTGVRPVYLLDTTEGYQVKLTAEHRVMTERGWVEAQHLHDGDQLHILNHGGGYGLQGNLNIGRILGWLVADGTFSDGRAVLDFYGEKRELAQSFADMVNDLVPAGMGSRKEYTISPITTASRNLETVKSRRLARIAEEYGLTPATRHTVPPSVMTGTQEMQVGYLQGIFSGDGTVVHTGNGNTGVRLSSSTLEMLRDVQRLLLNNGIISRIYQNRKPAGYQPMPDQNREPKLYWAQASHELSVTSGSLDRFQEEIGFLLTTKKSRLEAAVKSRSPRPEAHTARFRTLTPIGEEMVYDLTEPVTHSFAANGLVVSNCGEQPLGPNESCNLGSINLTRMVTPDGRLDHALLKRTCFEGVRLLDNVIDMNRYPLTQIEQATMRTRRIGMGVMGFADFLVLLGIPYDSPQGRAMAGAVMRLIHDWVHQASQDLATHRGPYPAFEGSIYKDGPPMRNSAPVTIAPTGTISTIAGASSGIEPLFALSYVRRVMDNTELFETNPYLEQILTAAGAFDPAMPERLAQSGSLAAEPNVPEAIKALFRVSHEIDPRAHVLMQAAFQKYTDNAVSKTINFPNEATVTEIASAYELAHQSGCKGVTIYRDRSKSEQVLNIDYGHTHEDQAAPPGRIPQPTARTRPRYMRGITERVASGHGSAYVTINFDEDEQPFEIFTTIGKAGGCDAAQLEAISRLASMALRAGIQPQEIAAQLIGITCCPRWDQGVMVKSTPDAIAQVLRRQAGLDPALAKEQPPASQLRLPIAGLAPGPALGPTPRDAAHYGGQQNGRHGSDYGAAQDTIGPARGPACPECHLPTINAEGCRSCPNCGWNKCE